MTITVQTSRNGMEISGSEGNWILGVGGKTLQDAKEFTHLMWEGPIKGDIAILYSGIYYVCDGIDPSNGEEYNEKQVQELRDYFGADRVIYL